ncbi:hypothetical protein A3766_12405 [Oleiphilus sp. HI0132]|uniref:Wzz/FepE/Etk N-terminal domain-containing protein n=1 Tax=Oleiphilus sp. HI0132 TaxID=1822270 RepID=UPI0007C2527C|nr:Wzz/FepE/Etk N-terminal domain-containing protein [Oleiphilus sp. HI0132]KZZ77006.1 hypothetical protein A3766_12405 [Oleiphilus sp. HI0132]
MNVSGAQANTPNRDLNEQEDIDLREVFGAIWKGKVFIVLLSSFFVVSSVFYALSLADEYKSTVLLAPASSSSGGGLSSRLVGQYSGLASLAGINLGGGAENKSVIAIELLKTWGFLERFIEDNKLQVPIFAAKGWDKVNNRLLIDPDVFDESSDKWVREVDSGQSSAPTSWELFKRFKERISIRKDDSTGLIQLSIEFYSPYLAKEWVGLLVEAINKHIKQQDRLEALRSIEYLTRKVSETAVSDMQSVFYQLIEEQTKTLMLAEVSEEYVLKTVSEAKVAEEKSKPKRALIVILSAMLGGMFATAIVLLRFVKNRRSINGV